MSVVEDIPQKLNQHVQLQQHHYQSNIFNYEHNYNPWIQNNTHLITGPGCVPYPPPSHTQHNNSTSTNNCNVHFDNYTVNPFYPAPCSQPYSYHIQPQPYYAPPHGFPTNAGGDCQIPFFSAPALALALPRNLYPSAGNIRTHIPTHYMLCAVVHLHWILSHINSYDKNSTLILSLLRPTQQLKILILIMSLKKSSTKISKKLSRILIRPVKYTTSHSTVLHIRDQDQRQFRK